MDHTGHAEYKFTVKEFGDGTPYLAAEPMRDELLVLSGGGLFFQLKGKPDLRKAQEVADVLNANIDVIGYTRFLGVSHQP